MYLTLDVLAFTNERCGDGVELLGLAKEDVGLVLLSDRRQRHNNTGQVDTFVLPEVATIDHGTGEWML